MAKPAKSAAQKRKELIDDQEFVSQKEKEEAKAKVDAQEKAAQAKANKENDLIGAKDSAKLNKKEETTKANKEADLPSAKDAEKLNKKETKSSSSAASKAKNSSSTKNSNLGTSKQFVSDNIARAAGAEEGIRKIEAAKTEKAAAQARENKEKDLPGFDGYAAQEAKSSSSAVDKAKNSSSTRNSNLGTSKQFVSDNIARAAGGQSGIDKIEAEKVEKAAAQAREYKEKDLPGYIPQEKQEPQIDIEKYINMDIKTAEQELENKKAEYQNRYSTVGIVSSGINQKADKKDVNKNIDIARGRILKQSIEDAEREILLAKQIQQEYEFASTENDADKLAKGYLGYSQWVIDKAAENKERKEKEEQQSTMDFIFGAMGSSSDTTMSPGWLDTAAKAYETDTSYKEPNTAWSDIEKYTFGYYYANGDIEKAEEYAKTVNDNLARAKSEKELEEISKWATKNDLRKFVASAGTVAVAPAAGTVDYLDKLVEYGARGTITEKEHPTLSGISGEIRDVIGKEINEKHGVLPENWGILSNKGWGDVYQIGLSAADSALSAAWGGKTAALVTAFGGSASSAVEEALARGATEEEALGYGTIIGAAELFPEYLAVDSLLNLGSAKTVNSFLGKVGKQAAAEGLEGAVTSLSGAFADEVVLKELSKFDNTVNNYMILGYSREEAEKMAASDGRADFILDVIGEAIGGGMSGAAFVGASSVANNIFGNNKNINVPEALQKAEVPVPFNGTAQPGTEAGIVAEKITEIENSSSTESEKAERLERVIEKVAKITGNPEVIAEAERIKNYHTERQAEFNEAVDVGKKLGVSVEFDSNIAGNGVHTSDGRIIINPNTENPALQVFVHELTHDIETSGLYGAFSEKILGHIKELGYDVNKIREQVKADYEAAGHNLTDPQLDAEVVAKYCEQHLFTDEKAIQRLCDTEPTIFQRIKNWISDMIVKFKGTAEERFLLEAERLYEKALATRGEVPGAEVEQHSYDYSKPFEQQIDDWKAGKIPSYDTLIVGATPKVFQDVGFNALPMTINQKHIDYALNGTKGANHFYGADIKKLPQALENPVAIISSKTQNGTSVVALVNLPVNGMETIVPVYVDGFGTQNTLMIDSNAITSVHGRNNTAQLLADAINDNAAGNTSVFYYNKKEAQSLLHQAGLQLPGRVIPHDGFNHSIRENSSSVKPKMDNVTESLQFKRWFGDWQKHPQNASKVVNPDGTPKVVYHGTRKADFTVFNRNFNFFTDNQEMADSYSPNGDMYEVYLDIKKPFVIEAYGDKWSKVPISEDIKEMLDEYGSSTFFEDGEWRTTPADIAYAVQDGIDEGAFDYDGIIIKNVDDTGSYYKNSDSVIGTDYIVFDSRQIKSATDNIGTFDQQNPDIRYSTGRGFDEIAAEAKTPSMERAEKGFDVESWKSIAESINPEIGIWRIKDFARVLDSAAGGNKVLRQQLYDLYEKPLNDAQGTYASNYAAKAQSITDKFKELGIKAESKESAAVQRIGEGVKEIDKHGNTVPYTLDDLKKDFPDSWQEIKEGADYCRKVYDDFLRDLNAMYSEIYPATVEQANERVSNYNIRIENDAKYIDRYTEVIETLENRKAEKQSELSKKRPDSLIYAEIQNQIANIDHKIDVAKRRIEQIKNRKLTKEISRDTLKAQIENGEILRNKQIKPRKDYFRHFQELTDEFAEIADIFSNDQRIPPNLAGKSETTKPRTIWTSIAQSRKNGNYYTEDAVSGLLKYTEIAEKLLVFDPLVSHFRDVNSAIRAAGTMVDNEVKGKGNNAGQFATWADDMTNQLAGKTNIIDRIIADKTGAFGRATIKAVEALNHRVKSNAILGNFRSALVQIGNLPNAMLYIQNPADWTMGAVSLTNPTEEIIDARAKSNFMNRRYMGDTIDALTKEIQDNNILDKPKEFALWMLGAGDKAAAELIWHTAYSRAVRNPEVLNSKKGLRNYADAIDYADDITRRSIGGRAEGDIPYFEESKITGLIAPFQIEVANTANALAEQIGKKNVAGIIAFEAGIWLINTVLEGITGDRPLGFDYIEAITDIVKEATGEEEEEEKDIWELVTFGLGRLAGETISGLPFGAQIGRAITGGDEQRAEEWFGDSDPSRYGTGNIGIGALADAADYFVKGETPKELFELATDGEKNSYAEWSEPIKETVDTFAPILMPWGGKQLSRTAGGIDQLIRGGAFGKDSNGSEYLKFPQEYDPESVIKTVLFGQYASDRGQEYIDSNFKSLSAKDTANMNLAEEYGLSKQEFYDTILGLREFDKKEEKQEAILQNENLDAREKGIIDWILFGDQKNFPESTRNYSSEDAFYRSGLETGELRLYEDGYGREEIDKIETALKKGGTKVEDVAAIQKALGCTEAEAFEIYERRNGKWIDDAQKLTSEEKERASGAAELYGMSTEDYLTVLNYSNFGTVVDGEYSNKMEDVIPKIMEATGWDRETATKNYNMVNKFDYSRNDLEDEQKFDLTTSQGWYEVDDKGYFVARNVIKTTSGTADEYGNTISGSKKEAAVKEIAKQLGIDEAEATIYYLAASGDLVLSADDLSSSQREDMEAALKEGWTVRGYIDAVNVLKVTGATKKEDILKDLQDAGASYSMAQGYYNLRQNKDYDRFVGKVTYKYGMKNEKQEMKGDYFLEHYGKGEVTDKDIAKWFAAAEGCKKKQEYIDAYMGAGATYQQALEFYNLIKGYNKTFNAWYKENGGQ